VDDDRVMSFDDWCKLNGFSRSTGQRIIASGQGPQFIQLSEKRKGVTVGENRRWQQSRVIETAA
jgi:predicted DNA-binding transcriptional regulator AlpA